MDSFGPEASEVWRHSTQRWLERLLTRCHPNVQRSPWRTERRIAWALLAHGRDYQSGYVTARTALRRDPNPGVSIDIDELHFPPPNAQAFFKVMAHRSDRVDSTFAAQGTSTVRGIDQASTAHHQGPRLRRSKSPNVWLHSYPGSRTEKNRLAYWGRPCMAAEVSERRRDPVP